MSCFAICIQPSPTQAHCSVCHVTFGSVSAFDRHRRDGECLDPATLPMHQDHRGIWRWDGQRSDLDADSRSNREPQTAERASVVVGSGSDDLNGSEAIPGGAV